MKKCYSIFLTGLLLIISKNMYSQAGRVGINTSAPQQQLHISGTSVIAETNIGTSRLNLITPTVRVEGLNSVNTTVFQGEPTLLNPLYTNTNGDISVVPGRILSGVTPIGGDAVTTPQTVTVTGNNSFVLSSPVITNTFTLQRRSMVFFSAALSASVVAQTSNSQPTDGRLKGILAVLQFTAAPINSNISLNSSLARAAFTYMNNNSNGVSDAFKSTITTEIALPAGTYTISLFGVGIGAAANPNSTPASSADDYRIILGNGNGDKLNVFIKPL